MQTFATAVAKNLPKQERQSKGCVASRYNLEQISNRIISQIKHIETTHNWMRVDKYFWKKSRLRLPNVLLFSFSYLNGLETAHSLNGKYIVYGYSSLDTKIAPIN